MDARGISMADTTTSLVQPLDGKTAIDDKMTFEPERLSYVAAADLAVMIAAEIGEANADKRPVVICDVGFLSDLANLVAIGVMLDTIAGDYQALGQQAANLSEDRSTPVFNAIAEEATAQMARVSALAPLPLTPLTAVEGVLNTALGIVSLFREDVSFSGVKTGVDALAFEIAVAAEMKKRSFARVLIPGLFVVPSHVAGQDSLLFRLKAIEGAKLTLWRILAPIVSDLVESETELDQASRDANQAEVDRLTGEIAKLRRDLSPITEPAAKTDQRFSEILTELQKVDADSGLTGLARLLRAEAIGNTAPMFLHIKVVSSGGHNRISRSLFRTLFAGDGLSFMGGVVARWALLNEKGEVEKGGILSGERAGKFPRT
jgi:hypothetical protein